MWEYYETVENTDPEITAAVLENEAECYKFTQTPTAYDEGLMKNWTKGMCGFKYLVINNDPDYANSITVMMDGASNLVLGAAALATALFAF